MADKKNDIRRSVIGNLIWRFSERTAAQGMQFIVSIVLARMLLPEDYGTISLITVFINILSIFVQSGFGNALIQKKHADQIDFSSVFYFNIFIGVLLYIILFASAPLIAAFYQNAQLVPLMRVLGINLIIGGVNGVQQAYVSRQMQFKKFFFSTLIGTVLSGALGIFMAYRGAGVWALVIQNLTNQFLNTAVLWITVKWRPQAVFSLKRIRQMFSFGSKLLASSLIDCIYNNLYPLFIGKVYSSSSLAYFNRGNHIPSFLVSNINSSIQSVLLPALSGQQDEKERLKAMVRRGITTSTFFLAPAMIGLAAIARPLTIILLTEKWLPSVPFMQCYCLVYLFWPIHTTNLQAINAVGRSDIYLKLEIVKKLFGFLVLLITIPMGLYAMMGGICLVSLLSTLFNAAPNKKILNYGYSEQFRDIFPSLLLSAAMGLIIWPISFLDINIYLMLVLQIVLGVIIYLGGAAFFKLEMFLYLRNLLAAAKMHRGF